MEAVFAVLGLILMLMIFLAGAFSLIFQPLWSIIDVASSEKHSSGTKASVILLTCLLLGPVMTFFYACFGSHSSLLKKSSITSVIIFLGSALCLVGVSQAYPSVKENLEKYASEKGFDRTPPGDDTTGDVASDDVVTGNTEFPLGESEMGEVLFESLEPEQFVAVNFVPVDQMRWSVSVANFTLNAPAAITGLPVDVPSIYPLNQVAMDASGPVFYGTTNHKVGKIIPSTGIFVELEVDPALPEMSWPEAIAFDSTNRKLVVSSRSGTYTFDPETGEWLQPGGFGKPGFMSLTYDETDHSFYGIASRAGAREITQIVKLSDKGAILSTIQLSHSVPVETLPSGRLQLIKAGDQLVILAASHYDRSRQLVPSGTYIVEPATGHINRVTAVSPGTELEIE